MDVGRNMRAIGRRLSTSFSSGAGAESQRSMNGVDADAFLNLMPDEGPVGLKQNGATRTRADWCFDHIGQLCIVVTQWAWTRDVEIAFDNMGLGEREAMKDYNKKQVEMILPSNMSGKLYHSLLN